MQGVNPAEGLPAYKSWSPRRKPGIKVGLTQHFVLARAIEICDGETALIDAGGNPRLMAEIEADPDRPDARPIEAYQTLLASIQPGWTLRCLRIFWPDPDLRHDFAVQIEGWSAAESGESSGRRLLKTDLQLYLKEAALPFLRRTILEFPLPPGEKEAARAWWEGLHGLLQPYGLQLRSLGAAEIEALLRWIHNPELA